MCIVSIPAVATGISFFFEYLSICFVEVFCDFRGRSFLSLLLLSFAVA